MKDGLDTVTGLHPGSHGWDAGSNFLEYVAPVDAVKDVGKSSKRVQRSRGGCWDLLEYGTLSEQWLGTHPSLRRRLGEELRPGELQTGLIGKCT